MPQNPGIKNYLSLIKFSHTVFALPFALAGYFLAIKQPAYSFDWPILIYVLLCMVFARTAAMAFNRFTDRNIDAGNERTAGREIPMGVIKPKQALALTIVSAALFITVTFFINSLVFYLSPVALAVILGYSYTKRFTALCHFILGLGLALAPIGAYLAVTAEFAVLPVMFCFVVLFWTGGFDIIYSLQDESFDSANRLSSIPSLAGRKNAVLISLLVHFLPPILLITSGLMAHFGLFYWIGTGLFSGLLFYQHAIIKHNDLSRVNMAFFTLNGIASTVFAVFFILDFFFPFTFS